MESEKQEPRWERRKESRPGELIQSALDVFVEKGYAATRLDEVAKRAGVSKGTVYLYFTNKEELFKAVVRDTVVATIDTAQSVVDNHNGSVADLVRKLMRTWWDNLGATPVSAIPKIIVSEAGNFPEIAKFYHEEVLRRGERMSVPVIQRGIESGEFRDVDSKMARHLIIAPFFYLCIWQFSFAQCTEERMDIERFVDMHIDMILRGLMKRSEDAS